MDKTAADSTVVLSVNINCCNACPKKAKKLLLKVKGVESVEVDREKGLVSVTGKADTNLLIKALGKMKKKAEIVPNETTSENKNNANQNAKTDEDSHAPPPAPANGIDEEVCRDQYCRIHNRHDTHYYPVMPEYRPMPPAFYHSPPWTRFRQDEYGVDYPGQGYVNYPGQGYSVNYPRHGYGGNYPGQFRPWF